MVESPLKWMKNASYCILKALFVLKMYKFLSRLFSHVGKTTGKKRLTSKFMTSQPGLQATAIHILLNIAQSKANRL